MKTNSKQPVLASVWLVLFSLFAVVLALANIAQAQAPAANTVRVQDKVTSGRFFADRPTLITAGFEWMIEGDENRNSKVEVTFRKKGETAWKPALPLMRIQNERLSEDLRTDIRTRQLHPAVISYTAPNAFVGSVFNLTPDTDYEFHFVLSDPDGISCYGPELFNDCKSAKERNTTVHTRPEPMPATGGNVYHVYPADWTGPKQEPSFTGLLAAYYMGAFDADYWNGYPARVQPGDVILMHKGVYHDTAYHWYYGHVYPKNVTAYGTFFDGTYYLHANGTPDKPIAIKAAGDGEVVIDGDGAAVMFDLTKANYNYFEGITFRNASIAFLVGRKEYWGADGFTLKHSKVENISRGVHCDWGLSKDFYIADNTFIGRTPADRLVGFSNPDRYSKDPAYPVPISGPNGSEYAVKVYGQGHVVAYNYAERWHDGFDIHTYGNPTAITEEELPRAIDFYNNDVSNANDNCFEMDGGARNIRYFRNRCFNGGGLSINPGFGGPFYFFQNVYYNSGGGSCNGQCAGFLSYQNTVISNGGGGNNTHLRNNLFISTGATGGGGGGGGNNAAAGAAPVVGPVLNINAVTNYSTSDYNGFRVDPKSPVPFRVATPPPNVMQDFDYTHTMQRRDYKTLQEYSQATKQDTHSVLVDYDIFTKVTPPIQDDNCCRLYKSSDYDFRLKAGSKAIDAGTVLPTINDGFTGSAPDLGALEFGKEPWHWGPRP